MISREIQLDSIFIFIYTLSNNDVPRAYANVFCRNTIRINNDHYIPTKS